MMRRCEPLYKSDPNMHCGKIYDDEFRWTICPHRPLDESPHRERK